MADHNNGGWDKLALLNFNDNFLLFPHNNVWDILLVYENLLSNSLGTSFYALQTIRYAANQPPSFLEHIIHASCV